MSNDSEIAALILSEERSYRFPAFTSSDAITLGLSLRKRFRGSSRHVKHNRGLLISIQSIAGHPLFACTVGDFDPTDTGLESWEHLEGMIRVVKKTGHSSYYVEKTIAALKMQPNTKAPEISSEYHVKGGAFPVWLQNAPFCPIAVVAVYGGSSQEDHHLVANTLRDYLAKMRNPEGNNSSETV